ncbi:MAG: glycoside hydrolase family 16 protein [Bacilli bacterium]|nr:glycoside hydrolase family 16 protein [Bacilli bacterium]
MKKNKFLILLIIFVIVFIIYTFKIMPPKKIYKINIIEQINDYALIEDFNDNLNNKYWSIINRGNNYNNELQYYSPQNIAIKNGILEIEAREEVIDNHQYTSGALTTKGKFEFLYGKIIFKAKPAIGQGLLTAIWLLPADDSSYPEIDIIEVLGNNPNEIWTGVHYLDNNSLLKRDFVNNTNNHNFLIYEFQWDENEITCYMNNQLIYKTQTAIPKKKMYLVINLAVGGDWPGKPKNNILPSKFLIDYVIVIPKENNI